MLLSSFSFCEYRVFHESAWILSFLCFCLSHWSCKWHIVYTLGSGLVDKGDLISVMEDGRILWKAHGCIPDNSCIYIWFLHQDWLAVSWDWHSFSLVKHSVLCFLHLKKYSCWPSWFQKFNQLCFTKKRFSLFFVCSVDCLVKREKKNHLRVWGFSFEWRQQL